MNESEFQRFEEELRAVKPAPVPEQFMARLRDAKPEMTPAESAPFRPAARWPWWSGLFQSLTPIAALATLVVLAFHTETPPQGVAQKTAPTATLGFKADDVQVNEQLVSSFDVVATLPGGEPVRFHCREWKDKLVATDKSRGMQIEQNNPRVEVVPVRFETY